MTLKNIFQLLFLSCFFACQQPQKAEFPVTPLELPEKTLKLATLSNFEAFEDLLTSEKGKVVLVNLWATWCMPCKHEMPLLEKLHQNYQEKGIKVVTLSLDDVAKADSLIVPYWEEMNFSMDNYLIATKDSGVFVNKIDPLWIGLLPTSFIFDTSGKKVETITGAMTYSGFEKKVLKVLNSVN